MQLISKKLIRKKFGPSLKEQMKEQNWFGKNYVSITRSRNFGDRSS